MNEQKPYTLETQGNDITVVFPDKKSYEQFRYAAQKQFVSLSPDMTFSQMYKLLQENDKPFLKLLGEDEGRYLDNANALRVMYNEYDNNRETFLCSMERLWEKNAKKFFEEVKNSIYEISEEDIVYLMLEADIAEVSFRKIKLTNINPVFASIITGHLL